MFIKLTTVFLIIFSVIPIYAQIGYDEVKINEFDQKIKETETPQNCNCVAFRLDDVQDYWLTESQISIIETFQNKSVPLTIGIIGSEFGEDPKITDFVIKTTNDDIHLIEIANHGWEHESFPTFDKKTQSNLIKKTDERLENIIGVKPKIFIAPLNAFNNDTMTALKENNYTHFSSNLEWSNPPFLFHGLSLYNFPSTATTGPWNKDLGQFQKATHEETFGDIKKNLRSYGFAVVTIHPQEFSTLGKDGAWVNKVDMNQIKELGYLIDQIQDSGLKIVFINQINENALENQTAIPEWFENVYVWWSEEQISNNELANAVKYLREHDIMKLVI